MTLADTIESISVSGLQNISRGTVLDYLPIEVGDDFSDNQLPLLIKSLEKTNFFEKVKMNFDSSSLKVEVKENPTIKFFEIINYKEDRVLSEKIVANIIDNYNFKIGSIFVKNRLDKLLEEINTLYSSNAFFGVKISTDLNTDTNNRIGISISIDEGDQALIKQMSITGSKFFSEEELLDLFSIGEPDFFIVNFFSEKDKFSKYELQSGIELVKTKYLNEGFLDIRIDSSNISFDKESNSIELRLLISEGEQYFVDHFEFTGNFLDISPPKLRKFIPLKDNDRFSRKDIIKGIDEITKFFENLGYAYTQISSKIGNIPNSNKLTVEINISLDSEIYISRINISGNNTTQDDVIRRQMSINEGQIYSRDEIKDSIDRIKRLGFFSDVKYEINRHLNNTSMVDINIEVTETKTGEFSIGLSHSNSTGASLSAGIVQKNILGTGNTLNASFSNSDAVQSASFYFLDPYFNKFGHSISYGFFDKTTNAAELDASSYILDETGFNFGYGIPSTKTAKFSSEVRISSIDLNCGASLKNTFEINQCNSNDDLDTSLSFGYVENSLNDFFFPSSGSKNIFETTIGLPFSDFKYIQTEYTHKSYYPVLSNKTFKFSSRAKLASSYGGDELPFFKRYFEGGNSSVRGFDFNSLGAKYAGTDNPKGGELSLVSSIGIASSLAFAGIDNPNMKLSGFIDLGGLSEKISDFSFSDIRSSTGLQLSWLTPIGPIGLHYATPVIKQNGDNTSTFSFDLGTTF